MSSDAHTRRRFLATLPALLLAMGSVAPAGDDHRGHGRGTDGIAPRRGRVHPEPRAGIDGSHVLRRAQLGAHAAAIPVFDMVRRMPAIADGIGCQCGCAEDPAYRSLLTCYEGEGMAKRCAVCQAQARLAWRLHREGRTLDEIRAAIDEEFG